VIPVCRRRRAEERLLVGQRGLDVSGRLREQPVELVALRVPGRREEPKLGRVLVPGCRHGRGFVALRLASLHEGVEVELVGVALTVNLAHDILVVIVPLETNEKVGTHQLTYP